MSPAIRVFLADDQALVRSGFRMLIESEDDLVVVGEASDGAATLRALSAQPVDVVLMDIRMPVMDGVEATRRVRRLYPDIQVVMLTMHADESVISEALRAGAAGYLVKDCSIEEIAAAIRMAANDEADLSPTLAGAMLSEVRRMTPVPSLEDNEQIVTRREIDVLQLIADGCSTPEVAERLFISQKTVKNHLASIYQKLDARDRTQAVLQAVRMGIVRLS